MTVKDHWHQIEAWLEEHRPGTKRALRQGTTEDAIKGFEESLDVTFPAALKESWLIHDGVSSGGYIGRWRLLSIKSMGKHLDMMRGKTVTDRNGERCWWNACWVPIAEDAEDNMACLDFTGGSSDQTSGEAEMLLYREREGRTEPMGVGFEKWLSQLTAEVPAEK